MVFNPGHDGGPVLVLVLISPAGPGLLAVLVPLERHIRVAREALSRVLPAVVEVLQVWLHGRLIRLVVEELVERVFGRILSVSGFAMVSYGPKIIQAPGTGVRGASVTKMDGYFLQGNAVGA